MSTTAPAATETATTTPDVDLIAAFEQATGTRFVPTPEDATLDWAAQQREEADDRRIQRHLSNLD